MDQNHKLETAESCKNVIDNAGKMSFDTTEVSPNNNNDKEYSEIFDDSMVCDDDNCIDNDVYVRRDDKNQSVQLPPVAGTEEIPPKYDTSCSEVYTFASPKSKRRKLPRFDELLENLHASVLVMNFTKLLLFLESNNKELTFPFTVKDYEELFEMIVQDINILKSKSLNTDYRDICDKIIGAATSYLLTCAYEYRQEFQKIVMVIKKEHYNMMEQSENGASSFSCSTESVMPISQTSSEVDSNEVLSRSPSPISRGFILHCLRTTLAFVKHGITNTKEFPELNLEQAQFMHLLLESIIAFTGFDSDLEIFDLYRALWEAVRINSTKYEFRIKCEESSGGKKCMVFEKVPKQKTPATAVNSNQIMNPKTDVLQTVALKPEAPKTDASKPEASKPEASKPEASKPNTLTQVASKPNAVIPVTLKPNAVIPVASKPNTLTPVASKPNAVIPVASKPNASKPEASKSKSGFPMPVIPKFMPEILLIKRLSSKFISDSLKTIREFLLDEDRHKLVFVPNSYSELDFYRNCLSWCRTTFDVSKFGTEFQEMHYQISSLLFRVNCTVNSIRSDKINATTGIKEVSYIKAHKNVPVVSTPEPAPTNQSTPKKKKNNLQNALQLSETHNIKLESVVDLNQSLRNKKKNKKLKKAKLKAVRTEATVKPLNQAKTWTDGSSSTCSSRGTSRDRSKVTRAQSVAKRAWNEIKQSGKYTFRETSRSRRGDETIRKEQLKEALSVPVQSDKAMRMMRGMGWSGGALGARGNGITEPLMPSLDLARGAGFGHSRNAQSEKIVMKPRESKTAPAFVSENSNAPPVTDETATDVIVQKTKQILLENLTFDTIMKVMKPQNKKESNVDLKNVKVERPRQTIPLTTQRMKVMGPQNPKKSNVDLEKVKVERPRQTNPLPTQRKTTVELPEPVQANVEPPKPTTSDAKQQLKPLITLTQSSIELLKSGNSNLEVYPSFRQEILLSILELFNSDSTSKTLFYENKICKKKRKFVMNAVKALKIKNNYGMFQKEEHDICRQIQDKYEKLPQVVFETLISYDFKAVELTKKVLTGVETPIQQESSIVTELLHKANTERISEANLHSYITSSGTNFESHRAYEILKFKVLFLLNILSFVKSFNEEVEITFNKVLNAKQKNYIQNVVDEVNMRIKFGSSPAETNLYAEIKSNVKDAFLVSMFNHQYTVVTLNKYFRFKRLNRPDSAVKRTSQTTVNLDAFSSETFSIPKLSTNERTVRESISKVAEINNKAENYDVADNNSKAENNNKPETNRTEENIYKIAENNSTYVAYEDNANAYVAYEDNGSSGKATLPEEPEVNEFDHCDSDNSNDEENNNCTVLKLPPGDISNLLCLYDEEKINTDGNENNTNTNNDSASKNNSNVTENRNIIIDNMNVVNDNNDNKVIDGNTKNTHKENNIVDTEMAEYVLCVEYTEAANSREITGDINEEKEVNITENKKYGEKIDQPIKHSDIVEIVNQRKVIGIGIDNVIDEVLANTMNTIDQNVIVIEDSDSNDYTETIVKYEIQNGVNSSTNDKDTKEDTDVIMIEIDDDEPMEVISITEESKQVIDKQDSVKVINKEESVDIISPGESMEEINKAESSKDVEIAKMEEDNSINPSDDQIVKGDLEIKTDGDIFSNEKLVLSEGVSDTHSVGLSHVKTIGTEIDVHNIHINKETEIKSVRIVHTNHPIEELNNENIKKIQRHISNSLMLPTKLPLLKCHGVQNGALIYSCHNKKTYDWLESTISVASYVKVLNTEVTKMALKLYCFFDFDTKDLFRMIELYNEELSTKDWVVEKTEKDGDYVNLIVRMDKFSVEFIQESDLALFAGIDKVQFSLIW